VNDGPLLQIAKFVIDKGGLAKSATFSRDLSMDKLHFSQQKAGTFTS